MRLDHLQLTNFRNYVKIAIENTLTTIFEQEQIYEEMLSLENDINDRDICSLDQVNDSKVLYLTTEIDDFLSSKLSYLDNKIVQLKMKGYKGIDIALILGINKKEVYKRINKIKDIVNNKFIKI